MSAITVGPNLIHAAAEAFLNAKHNDPGGLAAGIEVDPEYYDKKRCRIEFVLNDNTISTTAERFEASKILQTMNDRVAGKITFSERCLSPTIT